MTDEVRRQRGQALAAPGRRQATQVGEPCLTVLLSRTRVGFYLKALAGVFVAQNLTPLPGSEPELLGLVQHQGRLHPVFSLARLLGRTQAPLGQRVTILLLRHPHSEIGLAVDELGDFLELRPEQLRAPTPGEAAVQALTGDGVAVLDAAKLLAHRIFTGQAP
ncbi:MAG: chemotaxis protein CheW [Vulcanimicrobiota bacterium]